MKIEVYPHRRLMLADAIFALRPVFLYEHVAAMWQQHTGLRQVPFPFDPISESRLGVLNGWTITIGDRSFYEGMWIDPNLYHWTEYTVASYWGNLPRRPWDHPTWAGCILRWVGSKMDTGRAVEVLGHLRRARV